MAIQITNQLAATALKSEDALVTVQQSELSKLTGLVATGPGVQGTKVVVSSSGNIGYISEIPINGNVFYVKPANPDGRMDSNTPGILQAGEILTIG